MATMMSCPVASKEPQWALKIHLNLKPVYLWKLPPYLGAIFISRLATSSVLFG